LGKDTPGRDGLVVGVRVEGYEGLRHAASSHADRRHVPYLT
jgi:hypothetical protein